MFPFIRHTFEYPNSADPAKCLTDTLAQQKWTEMAYTISQNKVTLEHKLPIYFRNSWNPIFQGSIETVGDRKRLVGYFRVHWFVMLFMAFFIGVAGFQLLQSYLSPDVVTGYDAGWREKRLHFDLLFFVSLLLSTSSDGYSACRIRSVS